MPQEAIRGIDDTVETLQLNVEEVRYRLLPSRTPKHMPGRIEAWHPLTDDVLARLKRISSDLCVLVERING